MLWRSPLLGGLFWGCFGSVGDFTLLAVSWFSLSESWVTWGWSVAFVGLRPYRSFCHPRQQSRKECIVNLRLLHVVVVGCILGCLQCIQSIPTSKHSKLVKIRKRQPLETTSPPKPPDPKPVRRTSLLELPVWTVWHSAVPWRSTSGNVLWALFDLAWEVSWLLTTWQRPQIVFLWSTKRSSWNSALNSFESALSSFTNSCPWVPLFSRHFMSRHLTERRPFSFGMVWLDPDHLIPLLPGKLCECGLTHNNPTT